MTFAILDSIAYMLFQMLGNGYVMVGFFTLVIIIFLAAAKVSNPAVYFSILAPMLIGFVVNSTTTDYIKIAPWVVFPILIAIAIFFGIALYKLLTES